MHTDVAKCLGETLGQREKHAAGFGTMLSSLGSRLGRAAATGRAAGSLASTAVGGALNRVPVLGRVATKPVTRFVSSPTGMQQVTQRALSPGRIAATAGIGGGGWLAARDALVQNEVTPEQRFNMAQEGYKAQLGPMQQQLAQRTQYEAGPEYDAWYNRLGRAAGLGEESAADLRQRMLKGDFGGGVGPRLGGLNPFYAPTAAEHLGDAAQATSEIGERYQRLSQPLGDPEAMRDQLTMLGRQLRGAVLPEQRSLIQSQMAALHEQLDAPQGHESPYARQLRHRMLAMGMNDPPGGQEPASPAAPGASTPFASLAAHPWGLDDRVRRYALDPEDRGERTLARVRPGL